VEKLEQIDNRPALAANGLMDSIRLDIQMLYAGTEAFGAKADEIAVATWITALSCAGIQPDEMRVAVEHWITNVGGKTPTPFDVIEWVKARRAARKEAEYQDRKRPIKARQFDLEFEVRCMEAFGKPAADLDEWHKHVESIGKESGTMQHFAYLFLAHTLGRGEGDWRKLVFNQRLTNLEKSQGIQVYTERSEEMDNVSMRLVNVEIELENLDIEYWGRSRNGSR